MRQDAFTLRYGGLVRVLYSNVGICLPVTPEEAKLKPVPVKEYVAIWDTGATNSAITKKVVQELGLKPTGVVEVRHGGGKSLTNTYLINISVPSKVMFGQVRVTEVELVPDTNVPDSAQPQILIGMDIIGTGDFAVTNAKGKTTISFRTPALDEIDFVPTAKENNVMETGNRAERRSFEKMKRYGRV